LKIVLVRHAEVIEEYKGKYNGHIDIALSANGKLQAKTLAQKLDSLTFDKIYCSDLLRARETLEIFHREEEVIFTHRLREKSWGRDEGKSFEEITVDGREYQNFMQWIDALDGEDIQSYIENLQEYFNETILKEKCDTVLVVTHAGVIKTLLHFKEKISIEEAFSHSLPYSSFVTMELSQEFMF